MPNFLKINWGWLITISSTLITLGFTYRGLTSQIEKIGTVQVLQGNLLIAQDLRIIKLESVVSIKPLVDINTIHIDRLEKFMLETASDRAQMNAKLDSIQTTMNKLLELHMTK
jgi:hypothetical protein